MRGGWITLSLVKIFFTFVTRLWLKMPSKEAIISVTSASCCSFLSKLRLRWAKGAQITRRCFFVSLCYQRKVRPCCLCWLSSCISGKLDCKSTAMLWVRISYVTEQNGSSTNSNTDGPDMGGGGGSIYWSFGMCQCMQTSVGQTLQGLFKMVLNNALVWAC